jgi:hypothetical protein
MATLISMRYIYFVILPWRDRNREVNKNTNGVALLPHIWGCPTSNLSLGMYHPSCGSSCFPSVPPRQMTAHYLTLGHNHFHIFSNSLIISPFNAIMFRLLSASLHAENIAEVSTLLVTGLWVHFQEWTVIFFCSPQNPDQL